MPMRSTVTKPMHHVVLALLLLVHASGAIAQGASGRRSGFDDMGSATQAMQRDDAQNPAMLWAQDGAALWDRPAGASSKACSTCHGAAASSMRGVATRYPAFDQTGGRAVNLAQRINLCVQNHQQALPLALESQALLALETHVARQSRGLPIAPPSDPRLEPALRLGQALFSTRFGQLNLSCAQCHDERAGQRLGGNTIVQGHATGYPLYRLEWQSLGSLQRRLRNCMTGVRAEPYAYGAPEFVALEVFLAARSAGMPLETPAVRP